ncbi:MAG: hypothetical protein RBS77_01490 [Candidatus Moranbacteria bacterium]|jgi:hypothetical protein|nr:hypothetical protein [Candidatus Moranbacteria bacterium]
MKRWSKCKVEKDESEFYFFKKRNYTNSYCKACFNRISKQDREKYKEQTGVAYSTEWKRKDPEHRERSNAWDRSRNQKIKLQLVAVYGGKCTCCGETEPQFLTLEHLNKDGQQHREAVNGNKNRGGMKIYLDVIKRGFPSEYTILCMNCNFSEKDSRSCPHKTAQSREYKSFQSFMPNMN